MYHYRDCGLDNVYLKNGYNEIESAYGPACSINDLEGLHMAIGLQILECSERLTGQEIKFLRKEMDLSQAQLSEIIGVSENSIRGWENNRQVVTSPSDRLIRILYNEHATHGSEIRKALEKLSEMTVSEHCLRIELEATDAGWKTAA